MSRFKIYSKDGQTIRYEGAPTYIGTYLKPSCLEFREISSPVPIDWEVGDNVFYDRTGLTYRLYSIPQPKKQARRGSYGASFVYSGVQLYADTKQLEIAPFRDIVLFDNQIHFSTQQNIATFEAVDGIARRIQACMDDLYPGKWEIKVAEGLDEETLELVSEAREFSVSGGSCLDALDQIYSVWEDIGWIHEYDAANDKNIIVIGSSNSRNASNTTSSFAYGKGNGLTSLRKSQANADEMATRLYVYGSGKNMTNRYYNSLDIVDAESVDIQNLMIPVLNWGQTYIEGVSKPDAKKAFIQASDEVVEKFGLIPRSVYFDGNGQEEIYPSLQKMTIGGIRSTKRKIGDGTWYPKEVYSDDERVDEIKGVINPSDNGTSGTEGMAYMESHSINILNKRISCGPVQDIQTERGWGDFHFVRTVLASQDITYNTTEKRVVITPHLTGRVVSTGGTVYGAFGSLEVVVSGSNEDIVRTENFTATNVNGTWQITFPEISIPTSVGYTRVEMYLVGYVRQTATSPSPSVMFDSGEITVGVKARLKNTFTLYLRQIGFNINDMAALASQGKCTVAFKDGMNGGRSFTVKSASYRSATDDWELVMLRSEDTSLGMSFPNSLYPVNIGDHFVLLDIAMPQLYISVAEERLLAAGRKLLEEMSSIKPFYEPEIDAKLMIESHRVIREGMFMKVVDYDIIEGGTDYVIIDTLNISEGEGPIPTYKVTLREQKKLSFQQATSAELSSINQRIDSVPKNVVSGGEGTTNYEDLDNLPSIGGVVLMGMKDPYSDLGIVTKGMFEIDGSSVNAKYPFKAIVVDSIKIGNATLKWNSAGYLEVDQPLASKGEITAYSNSRDFSGGILDTGSKIEP